MKNIERRELKQFFYIGLLFIALFSTGCSIEEEEEEEEITDVNVVIQTALNSGTPIAELLETYSARNLYGKTYEGGIIAYLDESNGMGLLAGPTDISNSIIWGEANTSKTGATDLTIGSGNSNTVKIVDALGNGNYAAKICFDYSVNGYSDWFLPSINELKKFSANISSSGNFVTAASGVYWSSSETASGLAYTVQFATGNSNDNGKSAFTHRVRPARYISF